MAKLDVCTALLQAGFRRRYTICCGAAFGHRRYIAFAHGRSMTVVDVGQIDATKRKTLESLGWRIKRPAKLKTLAARLAQKRRSQRVVG